MNVKQLNSLLGIARSNLNEFSDEVLLPAPGLPDSEFITVCRTIVNSAAAGLLVETPSYDQQVIAKAIRNRQHRDGSFSTDRQDKASSPVTSLFYQAVGQGVQALRVLNSKPDYPLSFVDALTDHHFEIWVSDWKSTSVISQSGDIGAVLLCLIHHVEVDNSLRHARTVHKILDALEAAQDPGSGLWCYTDDVSMATPVTRQIISFFNYLHRPVSRVGRIIDSILATYAPAAFVDTPDVNAAAIEVLLSFRHAGYADTAIRELIGKSFDLTLRRTTELLSANSGKDQWRTILPNLVALRSIVRCSSRKDLTVAETAMDWPGPGFVRTANHLTQHERRIIPLWERPPGPHVLRARENPPAVSVIIPCFNLGEYLYDAIASIDAQTSHDFELIIVNDGSTDDYTAILLDELRSRGVHVLNQENKGVAWARNNGISAARGRYVTCLDPDDRLRPPFLEKATAILDSTPDVGLVSGYFQLFDGRDEVFEYAQCQIPEHLVHNQAIEPAVFRRQVWETVGGYCTTFSTPGIEDWDLWINILRSGYRAMVIPEIMWDYRVRPSQMSDQMYNPENWARLCGELAVRHAEVYRQNVEKLVSLYAERWAALRRYTNDQEHGVFWWQQQARNWQRCVGIEGQHRQALQARIRELESAVDWWQTQSENWRKSKEELHKATEDAQKSIEELTTAKTWWESQASLWKKIAEEKDT